MLVLSRRVGEEVVIARNIRLRITRIDGNRVRLGIEAPATVSILRNELIPFGKLPAGAAGESHAARAITGSDEP